MSSSGFLPNPKAKLLDQVREVIRFKHYSIRTEEAYVHWIKRFIFFHNKRHPREMAGPEVAQFLSDLAVRLEVAAATQNQALNALIFLYRHVLKIDLGNIGEFSRVRKPPKLPVVLTQDEARQMLTALPLGTTSLILRLLYGTGMRLQECLRLRVKDLDFATNRILVREGKGFKDRVTMLPLSLKDPLQQHLQRVHLLHAQDLAEGFGQVYLPYALARKYPHAEETPDF